MTLLLLLTIFFSYMLLAHQLCYSILKRRTLKRRRWDLNISCGKTDGGGINADIKKHKSVPNFVLVEDIHNLPFKNKQFNWVLSSHTIEHVDDPEGFFKELKRVGENVLLVVPPLWDLGSAIFSQPYHKWTFLTFRREHKDLPRFIPLPFAKTYQRIFGQGNVA